MCRLSAFFGAPICAADLVTRPSRSVITQSFDARERMSGDASTPGYLNGDGFGLGWYSPHPDDPTPCIYRQARPAWNDPNLGSIAEKVFTPVLFAHVRAASPGLDVSETTCHPFRYGRYLWMHNGGLGSFVTLRRHLLPTLSENAFDFAVNNGSSDSALCFAVFLSLIHDPMAPCSPEKLRDCLEHTISILQRAVEEANVMDTSLLNFVVSDGESLVASRYVICLKDPDAEAASLYYASGNSYQSDGTAPGNYAMMHTDRRPSLSIISSEPLTERRSDWVSVPRNFTIVITKSMHILLSPVNGNSDHQISRILVNLSEARITDARSSGRLPELEHSEKVNPSYLSRQNSDERSLQQSPQTRSLPVGSDVQSTIKVPGCTVLCCAVMGSLLCSGTDDGSIHIWDMEDNMSLQILQTGQNAVLAILADLKSGILVTGTSASTISLYKLTPEKVFVESVMVCCEGNGDVLTLELINERIFAGFSDSHVRCVVKDIAADMEDTTINWTDNQCSGSGRNALVKVSISDSGHTFPSRIKGASHNGFVFAITPCLRNRFLCTGSGDGILRIWNLESEECIQTRDDHTGAILVLTTYEVSHGTMLFSGSRDCAVKVWVWDGDSGFICKRTLRKHKDEVVFLTTCGDKLISGSADGVVCVWCVESLALLCQYRVGSLKAGAVSLEYNQLFTASNLGAIQVRDVIPTRNISNRDLNYNDQKKNTHDIQAPEMAALTATKFYGPTSETDGNHVLIKKQNSYDGLSASFSEPGPYQQTNSIASDKEEGTDDMDSLVPGISNDLILAPPISPLKARGSIDENGLFNKSNGESEDKHEEDIHREAFSGNKDYSTNYISSHAVERRLMQDVLTRFISFATVSGSEDHKEACWQGARYLGNFLEGLGASVKLVSTNSANGTKGKGTFAPSMLSNRKGVSLASSSGTNPVVLARFASANPSAKTIAFYGHYDVMPADSSEWKTDPWTMTCIDGYLYGRGATDNKGPILAIVFAIKKILEESRDGLGINIVLAFQGEGEVANNGFRHCIESHMHWFENVSLIITSNSCWLGEEKPCITYGFRGVIELLVSITGGSRNLHSGVDGGAILEPMNDLITILGTIMDSSGVACVPGFYDDVRPLTEADKDLLQCVDFDVKEYHKGTGVKRFISQNGAELLECRWRKPSISITCVESSNTSGFYSVVPRKASAKISIRFVPDQDPTKLEKEVETHLEFELRKRRSPNELSVDCINRGDWWLEDPACEHFQIAARAVKSVWGVEPEYVCEGGSMPLFSYLAKKLNAPLIQVPLGQSSDGAHLPNERIRAVNLFRGKDVLQSIIQEFART